jgi:GTP cyclohydrolase I
MNTNTSSKPNAVTIHDDTENSCSEIDYTNAMEYHVKQLLQLLRLPVDSDDSLRETPRRVTSMLQSFCQPFDPEALLKAGFQTDAAGDCMVTQSDIPFDMMCEHHLAPAIGRAYIAYLPGKGRVVGLSKLARLVRAVGHERPTLQENATHRIANILSDVLGASGVFVVIKAEHTCMTCRGVHTHGVTTTTSCVKGIFRDAPQAKTEAMNLLGLSSR